MRTARGVRWEAHDELDVVLGVGRADSNRNVHGERLVDQCKDPWAQRDFALFEHSCTKMSGSGQGLALCSYPWRAPLQVVCMNRIPVKISAFLA
jgi:hypothetical protein